MRPAGRAGRAVVDGLTTSVEAHAQVPVETLFETVVAEDVLPHVLHPYRFIPGVATTSDLSGPWDTPGSTRTIHLTNGGRARERVDAYRHPEAFAYTVSSFTGPFGGLADHAVGTWSFSPAEGGSSFIWTYRFAARPGRKPLLAAIVRAGWAGYMSRAAERCARRAEARNPR